MSRQYLFHRLPIRPNALRLLRPTRADERAVTVLPGTCWTGVGETFDESRLQGYRAGSFYVIPAGIPHFSAVLDGEVVVQEGGFGTSGHDRVE